VPREREKTLFGYLLKDEKTNTVRVYDKNPPRSAKEIKTRYRVVKVKGDNALVEVELLTGRTHQIRAHMAFIGHSLVGDGKYGVNRDDRKHGFDHQALCSYKLRFSFKGDPTALEYLNGKEFSIPIEEIEFAK
jgi:23S rRNA pseudouridine955/2504/2580 synthase